MSKPKGFDIDSAQLIKVLRTTKVPRRYNLWLPLIFLAICFIIAEVLR